MQVLLVAIGIASIAGFFYEKSKAKTETEKVHTAVHAAGAGRWIWYMDEDRLEWDDEMFVIWGRQRAAFTPTYAGFLATVHPDDVDRVDAQVQATVKAKGSYRAVFRIVCANGKVVKVRAAGGTSAGGRYMTGICLRADIEEFDCCLPLPK
ncbi:hypothetical protein LBMAG57_36100 [Verrucomicrobiota bacterium]|nr:hypothetical protein LBMAG57_36100 [Verrucomicrobiota bacterium]